MNKDFTLKTKNLVIEKKAKPNKTTLDFLKQFARTYYAEEALSENFKGTILN